MEAAEARCAAARESSTLGGLAARQPDGRTASCAANVQYGAGWAQRLPADLPLYPQARVNEAAGTDGGSCQLRVVSFSSPQPIAAMLDWYYTHAVHAGYTSEHQVDGNEHILTLHVWSQARGKKQAHEIMGALRAALHDQPLELSGHRMINLLHEHSEARRDLDGETYHGIVRFRATTEPE